MIKRIVFDVDNTLIEWKEEYYQKIDKPFQELKIDYTPQDLQNVVKAISNYEKEYSYFKIEYLQEMFCKTLGKQLPKDFTNIVLKYFKTCVPEKLPQKDIDTLKYLHEKYELVVLTNWFEEVQIQRLKKVDILQYFKEVYATETIKIKPNPESFQTAIGKQIPQECIMVGDNLKTDIQGAIQNGLQAIYINPSVQKDNTKPYQTIHQLSELREIL